MIMRRTVIICIALAFGILTRPLAAQQAIPDQPLPPVQQAAPEPPPPPPAEPQYVPEAPPPFPPMPAARPAHRWVNVGSHRARHAHHRVCLLYTSDAADDL